MPFTPNYRITPSIATCLMRIEAARQAIEDLPITPSVLVSLRETARLFSTHYSTMIEGNRLTQEQVSQVIEIKQHFPGRERAEKEVLGSYSALENLESLVASRKAWRIASRVSNVVPKGRRGRERKISPSHSDD